MSPDVAASVRARLLNRAKASGEEFELTLARFAAERLLFRLGACSAHDRCILKGASLLTVWLHDPYRATRDVDVLLSGQADDAAIRSLLAEVCAVTCPEDAIRFDLSELVVEAIRAEEDYVGKRARFRAFLGNARVPVQVDFGIGDAITAQPEEIDYPTLLETLPRPRLRAYPREASVAEKFEAMVKLDTNNSRMKDFHDIWALSEAFPFDGPALQRAIAACFERRGTRLTNEAPRVLTSAFYQLPNLQTRWRNYRATGTIFTPPPIQFEIVGEQIGRFLEPVWKSIVMRTPLENAWASGGPWTRAGPWDSEGTSDMSNSSRSATRQAPNRDTEGEHVATPIRYKPYQAYKDFGIKWLGQIPAHWQLRRLKHIVAFRGGGTPAKDNLEYWRGDIPWVSPKDMKVSVVSETEDRITTQAVRESATKLVPEGSVLVVVRSGILVHSIPVAIAGREVTLNQDLKALLPGSQVVSEYLMYLISGMQRELLVEWRKEGATVESLEFNLIVNTPTPLPSISEQRAIAAFLDRETAQIDGLVANKERLIELLQEQRAALITSAVTKGLNPKAPLKDSGIEWLGQIPVHWVCLALARVTVSRCDGPFGSGLKSEHYAADGVRVIRLQNIGWTEFADADRAYIDKDYAFELGDHNVEANDLLIAGLGDEGHPVGRACVAPDGIEPAIVKADCFRFRLEQRQAVPRFLAYQLSATASAAAGSLSTGATRARMNLTTTATRKIALPPLEEQRAIADVLDAQGGRHSALIARVADAIERLEQFRAALISAAVTGKIDVREEIS